MDAQRLKGLIVTHDGKQETLAKAMGISLPHLNAKINERDAEFTKSEIEFIRDRYKISKKDLVDIFFS